MKPTEAYKVLCIVLLGIISVLFTEVDEEEDMSLWQIYDTVETSAAEGLTESYRYNAGLCAACNDAFDRIDKHLEEPVAGYSDVLLEADVLDSNLCRHASLHESVSHCMAVIDELEAAGAIRSYIAQRTPSETDRVRHCFRWCTRTH